MLRIQMPRPASSKLAGKKDELAIHIELCSFVLSSFNIYHFYKYQEKIVFFQIYLSNCDVYKGSTARSDLGLLSEDKIAINKTKTLCVV